MICFMLLQTLDYLNFKRSTMLTGKILHDFNDWYCDCAKKAGSDVFDHSITKFFHSMHDSLKFGMVADFLDEKDIYIGVYYNIGFKSFNCSVMTKYNGGSSTNSPKTRKEANQWVIEKVIEIYNK